MIIKIIAATIIVASSAYIGMYMASRFDVHVKQLESFQKALAQLEFEITFLNLTVVDALAKISGNRSGTIKKIFSMTSENLKNNRSLSVFSAWKMAIDNHKNMIYITKDEIEILNDFALNLGTGDKSSEISNIKVTCLKLKVAEDMAREEREHNTKLYKGMGILTGLLVVILIF
ncbi:MAG: stage III sporulation protein AB [Oscillospiraceae bacterium]